MPREIQALRAALWHDGVQVMSAVGQNSPHCRVSPHSSDETDTHVSWRLLPNRHPQFVRRGTSPHIRCRSATRTARRSSPTRRAILSLGSSLTSAYDPGMRVPRIHAGPSKPGHRAARPAEIRASSPASEPGSATCRCARIELASSISLGRIGPCQPGRRTLARSKGLEVHGLSVRARLDRLNGN